MQRTKKKRHRYAEKREWVLALLTSKWEYLKRTTDPPLTPFVSATDEEDQEAWEAAFGGAVKIYTMGPNVSPDFARTLRRMWMAGDLRRSVLGNQDARSCGQKTWFISYTFAKLPEWKAQP